LLSEGETDMPGEPTILSLAAAMLRRRRLFILLPMVSALPPWWWASFGTNLDCHDDFCDGSRVQQLEHPDRGGGAAWPPDRQQQLLGFTRLLREYLGSDAVMEALVQAPLLHREGQRPGLAARLPRVSGSSDSEKVAKAALRLGSRFWTLSNPGTATVQISAKFGTPLVATAVVDRALDMVQEFNQEKRQSQARSEAGVC
jgi:hypothetical protein